MELAKESFTYKGTCFTVLDAPGRQQLTSEVIKGSALADTAVLVVSVKKQELKASMESRLMFEHLKIVKGLGITQLIVAVNKMETAKWARSKFDLVKDSLEPELLDLGFLKQNTQFVPLSGANEQNITKSVSLMDWY